MKKNVQGMESRMRKANIHPIGDLEEEKRVNRENKYLKE